MCVCVCVCVDVRVIEVRLGNAVEIGEEGGKNKVPLVVFAEASNTPLRLVLVGSSLKTPCTSK